MFSKSLTGTVMPIFILSLVKEKETYGYEIGKKLFDVSKGKMDYKAGSLYPLLKKMEQNGLLKSKIVIYNNERPRRYYKILKKGENELVKMKEDWDLITNLILKLG